MKVEWKKLMFGLAIGAGMMMMASCSDEENFDPGGSTGKETPEPSRESISLHAPVYRFVGQYPGGQSTRQLRDVLKSKS